MAFWLFLAQCGYLSWIVYCLDRTLLYIYNSRFSYAPINTNLSLVPAWHYIISFMCYSLQIICHSLVLCLAPLNLTSYCRYCLKDIYSLLKQNIFLPIEKVWQHAFERFAEYTPHSLLLRCGSIWATWTTQPSCLYCACGRLLE